MHTNDTRKQLLESAAFAELIILCRSMLLEHESVPEKLFEDYWFLSEAYHKQGDFPEAIEQAKLGLKIATEQQSDLMKMKSNGQLGNTYLAMADYPNALQYFLTVLAFAEKHSITKDIVRYLNNVGALYIKIGDYKQALEYIGRALYICEQTEDNISCEQLENIYGNLGIIYKNLSDFDKAISYLERLLELATKQQKESLLVPTLLNLGVVYKHNKQYEKAIEYYLQALATQTARKNLYTVALATNNLASLYVAMEEFPEAKAYVEQSKNIALAQGYDDIRTLLNIVEAQLALHESSPYFNLQQAVNLLEEALQIATDLGVKNVIALAHEQLADAYAKLQSWERAFYHKNIYYTINGELAIEEAQRRATAIDYEREIAIRNREIALTEQFTASLQQKNNELAEKAELIEQQKNIIEQNLQELQQLSEFKEMLMGTIVHDLKNPLNIILNSIPTTPACAQEYLPALQSATKMLRMVTTILDVQKLESAGVTPVLRPTVVESFLRSSCDDVALLIKEKRVRLVLEQQYLSWQCLCDEELTERVVINLLTNAVKYTPSGGEIRIGVQPYQGKICIAVTDSGEGIPEEFLPTIFDKFTQVGGGKKSGKAASTGLGLTFCKLAVEAMGGTISVDSTVGKGTTFSLLLNSAEGNTEMLPADEHSQAQELVFGVQKQTALTEAETEIIYTVRNAAQQAQLKYYQYSDWMNILDSVSYSTPALQQWREDVELAIIEANGTRLEELLSPNSPRTEKGAL